MSKKTYTHRKRIVFTALQPYFLGEKLLQAMVIWEEKYSNAPSMALKHFVNELKNVVDPNADIRAAHLNLVRLASLPESELKKDPSADIERYLKRSARQKQSKPENHTRREYLTMQKFIRAWQSHFTAPDNRYISAQVIEKISELKLNRQLTLSFARWLANQEGSTPQVPTAETDDLRKIINLFYVASCEHVGPVKTDEVFGRVVHAFQQTGGVQHQILVEKLL